MPGKSRAEELVEYRRIIGVDVPRSMLFKEIHQASEPAKEAFKANLTDALVSAIAKHPDLHYSQGLNSIGATVLLGEGPEKCRTFLNRFLMWHGSPYCQASLKETNAVLGVLDTLISAIDPEYGSLLRSQPLLSLHMYALDSIMTWFSHASPSAEVGCQWHRLLSSRHPLLVVYAVAVLAVSKRDLVLREFAGSDAMAVSGPVHTILKRYPLSVSPTAVMAMADAWAVRLPPRDLLLASSEDTRETLKTVPVLWADASEIPNIWSSEEDGDRADAGLPKGLGSKAMAMADDPDALARSSGTAKTARISRAALARCVNQFSPAPTGSTEVPTPAAARAVGAVGAVLAALLVATLAAHWASEAITGESVVIAAFSKLARLLFTGEQTDAEAGATALAAATRLSPERAVFTQLAAAVLGVVNGASATAAVVVRGVSSILI